MKLSKFVTQTLLDISKGIQDFRNSEESGVAENKGRSYWKVFFLSLLLSPLIGFIVVALLDKSDKIGKKYQTPLSEFKQELQPNGRTVECIEDKGNGFLVVKCDDETEPKIWLMEEKYLTEIV